MQRHLPYPLFIALLCSAASAAPSVAPVRSAPAQRAIADNCVPPPVGDFPFSPGETLEYDFNALGATLGGLTMKVLSGRPGQPILIEARGGTHAFTSGIYPVDAVATSFLAADLTPQAYQETTTEKGVHYALDVALPPRDGKLHVRATKEGDRQDFDLKAPEATRDIVSALFAVRGMQLTPGAEICMPVFSSRRIWLLRVKVDGREKAGVPLGEFPALHVSGSASLLDRPSFKRDVHFWYSDDANRLPLAACGTFQGKPTCANLKGHTPGRRKLAATPVR